MDYSGLHTILGPPGTGKSDFLKKQIVAVSQKYRDIKWDVPIIVCSLTKAAANELLERDTGLSKERIGTLHSHAFRALGRPVLAESKTAEFNKLEPQFAIGGEAVDEDIDAPDAPDRKSKGDAMLSKMNLLRAKMEPRERWPSEVQEFAQAWEEWKAAAKYKDFTDLIEHAARDGVEPNMKMKILMVDEFQDLSPLEENLVRGWAAKCDASFMAGDPFQSIYGWRGAGAKIFFDPSIPEGHRKVLRQSYRVPGGVRDSACGWMDLYHQGARVPDWAPTPERGAIRIELDANWKNPDRICAQAAALAAAGESAMILATCGYLLGPTITWLRQHGVPFSNPWRPKHGGWNPLSKRKGVSTAARVAAFMKVCEGKPWTVADVAKFSRMLPTDGLMVRGARKALEDAEDNNAIAFGARGEIGLHYWFQENESLDDLLYDASLAMQGNADAKARMKDWLERRFSASYQGAAQYAMRVIGAGHDPRSDETKLFVGSVHSVKGGEAAHVFAFPDLSSTGAERAATRAGRDEMARLFYVAITRASRTVTVARSLDPRLEIPVKGLITGARR